jgi:hypothetical protein
MFPRDQQHIQTNRNIHQLISPCASKNFMAHQQGVQNIQSIANVHTMQNLQLKSFALQQEVEHLRHIANEQARELQQFRFKQEHQGSDGSKGLQISSVVGNSTMQTEQCSRQETLLKSIADKQQQHIIGRARAGNTLFPWTAEEDWILLELEKMYVSQWGLIASLLPGRTHQDVQSRWRSLKASRGLPANNDNQMHPLAATASLVPINARSMHMGTEEKSQQAEPQKFASKEEVTKSKHMHNKLTVEKTVNAEDLPH